MDFVLWWHTWPEHTAVKGLEEQLKQLNDSEKSHGGRTFPHHGAPQRPLNSERNKTTPTSEGGAKTRTHTALLLVRVVWQK